MKYKYTAIFVAILFAALAVACIFFIAKQGFNPGNILPSGK